jgi:hypothetical protein
MVQAMNKTSNRNDSKNAQEDNFPVGKLISVILFILIL